MRAATFRPWMVALSAILTVYANPAAAAPPTADELLPAETVLYVHIPHTTELKDRFLETGWGRMSQDAGLQPLLGHLYGSAAEAWRGLRRDLDLELDELLAIPQGAVTLAVVAPPEQPIATVLLVETGDQLPAAQRLLKHVQLRLEQGGAVKTDKSVAGTTITAYDRVGPRSRQLAFCERDSTILVATSLESLESLLDHWQGKALGPTLADNPRFRAIMSSVGADSPDNVDFAWFADPIEFVRALGQRSTSARLGAAMLPALGLDGVHGVGGSMALAVKPFDLVTRIHVRLDQPRAGAVDLLALRPADLTPEDWVPDDIASYSTLDWDIQTTYDKLETLFDSFQGDGALRARVQQSLSDPLGVDFASEVLPALTGRITHLNWIEQPIRTSSEASLLALHLKDAEDFEKTWKKITEKQAHRLEKKAFGSVTYYQRKASAPDNAASDATETPLPCFAVAHGCLLATDRDTLLERVLVVPPEKSRLASALDFKLIRSRGQRLAGHAEPGMLYFSRAEEDIRFLHGLAVEQQTQQQPSDQASQDGLMRAIRQALEQSPLPPLEALSQYVAPSGAVLYDDDSGLHYIGFTLMRNASDR